MEVRGGEGVACPVGIGWRVRGEERSDTRPCPSGGRRGGGPPTDGKTRIRMRLAFADAQRETGLFSDN